MTDHCYEKCKLFAIEGIQVTRLMNSPLNDSVTSALTGSELDNNGNMQDIRINSMHDHAWTLSRGIYNIYEARI